MTAESSDIRLPVGMELVSPVTGEPLHFADGRLISPGGESFPVVGGIPRFVGERNYAKAFGLQWKKHRLTQLDSFTGTSLSRDRLRRCLGGSFDLVRGKCVLEAGCGAGRFTEILLQEGAKVFAADLSVAVEANFINFRGRPDYFVCQADILKLPVPPGSFDTVVCLGVVQHTPSPEETIRVLCSYLKPGGTLVMDHYTHSNSPITPSRRFFRAIMLRMPPRYSMMLCSGLVALLWPLHRFMWTQAWRPGLGWLRRVVPKISPVADYYSCYPLGVKALRAWAELDTHDTLTDRYKHLRSAEQIEDSLTQCGMTEVNATYGGNGVEARARKPMHQGESG